MILPQTRTATLLILVLALVCLSSWANTFKMGGKRRYELYYLDWIAGAFATAVLIALTLGSLGFDGFSFRDDLMIAARHSWLYAFVSGGIFNLGNMLLMASLSLAGMAVAFPVAAGTSLIVAAVGSFVISRDRPATFLALGCALVLGAIIAISLAYRAAVFERHEQTARSGKAKSTRRPPFSKPLLLAAVGGLFLGGFFPLADKARAGEIGLGPYSFGFLFVLGAAASALFFDLFFMNLPVEGEPLEIPEYFRGGLRQHAYGFAGGVLWCLGTIAAFVAVASGVPEPAQAISPLTYSLTEGAALFAALWGLLAWKELRSPDGRVSMLAGMMAILLAGGIAVLAVALRYAGK
jgi:glucose uptake protein